MICLVATTPLIDATFGDHESCMKEIPLVSVICLEEGLHGQNMLAFKPWSNVELIPMLNSTRSTLFVSHTQQPSIFLLFALNLSAV